MEGSGCGVVTRAISAKSSAYARYGKATKAVHASRSRSVTYLDIYTVSRENRRLEMTKRNTPKHKIEHEIEYKCITIPIRILECHRECHIQPVQHRQAARARLQHGPESRIAATICVIRSESNFRASPGCGWRRTRSSAAAAPRAPRSRGRPRRPADRSGTGRSSRATRTWLGLGFGRGQG